MAEGSNRLVLSASKPANQKCFLKSKHVCRLVEDYPSRALSWFAVGCYYLCTLQHDKARRYFGKATTMENNFAAAWIGFGNAFAFQDESDQVGGFGITISSISCVTQLYLYWNVSMCAKQEIIPVTYQCM